MRSKLLHKLKLRRLLGFNWYGMGLIWVPSLLCLFGFVKNEGGWLGSCGWLDASKCMFIHVKEWERKRKESRDTQLLEKTHNFLHDFLNKLTCSSNILFDCINIAHKDVYPFMRALYGICRKHIP